METVIDDRGPYLLELISNADLRRTNRNIAWVGCLTVSDKGHFAMTEMPRWDARVLYLPHTGEGEPRP